MTKLTKPETWGKNVPVLEASSVQLAKCGHCGGVIILLEAEDGSYFASAHIGDNPSEVLQWIVKAFEKDVAIKRGEALQ
jgi:hypothetical protein